MTPRYPRYPQQELVSIISEFYTFLAKFYIPSSSLKFPPAEGWPNITMESTEGFGKAACVIDLLRHLPYIGEEHAEEQITNIHFESDVIDYSVRTPEDFANDTEPIGEMALRDWIERMEQEKEDGEDEEDEDGDEDEDQDEAENEDTPNDTSHDSTAMAGDDEDDENENDSGVDCDSDSENWESYDDLPEDFELCNMITLAEGHGCGGSNIVLDVFKGDIHEDIRRSGLLSPVDAKSFFDGLRAKYEKLELVPVPRDHLYEDVPDVEEGGDGLTDLPDYMLQRRKHVKQYKMVYRNYGWPGEGYRKEEALNAIEAYRQRVELEES